MRQEVNRARQCINRLEDIAARPNRLSEVDYIDLLIETERLEKNTGWDDRVRYLQEARALAETARDVLAPGEFTPKQFRERTHS
jgi:hypothetical protein